MTNQLEMSWFILHPITFFLPAADDCFELGRISYDLGDFYHAILWFQEATKHLIQEDAPHAVIAKAYDYLAFSLYKVGGLSHRGTNSLARALWDAAQILRRVIFKLLSRIGSFSIFKLLPDEYHKTASIISQHSFRYWLGVISQQAITWTNVDQVYDDIWRH